ncbi:MAG: hypothetical protein ACETVX_01560 [bacterium]
MYNRERLLIVFLFAISLLFLSCDVAAPKNSLVINKINKGDALEADILDYWTVGSGEEMEEFDETPSYSVMVEASYIRNYGGLPRVTSYAMVDEYTVDFKDITPGESPVTLTQKVQGACTFFIEADPEGKEKEEAEITILPREWILLYYDELEDGKVLKATITLKGEDSKTGDDIEAKGYLTIDIGDLEDDINVKGE